MNVFLCWYIPGFKQKQYTDQIYYIVVPEISVNK